MTAAVALAAGVGAVLRYLVDAAVARRWPARIPIGTLVVNVSGSLLLGLLVGLHSSGRLGEDPLAIGGAGVLGGYTTLSTFAWDVLRTGRAVAWRWSAGYAVSSVGLGLLAAAAGLVLGSV